MFLSAHWALLLKLPSDRSKQVSSTKIRKWSDFFWLFSIFLSGSLYFARIVPNKYLSKNSENCGTVFDFFPFFQLFPSPHRNLLPIQPNKYLSTKTVSGAFFQTFFDFSFRKPAKCSECSKQVSFQKSPKWFRFFWFFLKNLFYCLDFHTSIFPKTGDRGPLFLNFSQISFQQHGYAEKASCITKKNAI